MIKKPEPIQSDFCKRLVPVSRILEDPDYRVWGCAPIYGEDGRVHVYYSRWKNEHRHRGWLSACEIGHAVADTAEGPFKFVDVALTGRGGNEWDSWTICNPSVYKVNDLFVLVYLGTDGSSFGLTADDLVKMSESEAEVYYKKLVRTKRVGMAVSKSANGPWKRVSDTEALIDIGKPGEWDDICTTNPLLAFTPEGKFHLYYKSWSEISDKIGGNRKYGLAISDKLEGPYVKHPNNPIIDFSVYGEKIQCEDAYAWHDGENFKYVSRGMGVFDSHDLGLFMTSDDGIKWGNLQVGFLGAKDYFDEPLPGLPREGRFERPQVLFKDNDYKTPQYLFCAFVGGKYKTSSGVVLKINEK